MTKPTKAVDDVIEKVAPVHTVDDQVPPVPTPTPSPTPTPPKVPKEIDG